MGVGSRERNSGIYRWKEMNIKAGKKETKYEDMEKREDCKLIQTPNIFEKAKCSAILGDW